jgi:hypothetical protein
MAWVAEEESVGEVQQRPGPRPVPVAGNHEGQYSPSPSELRLLDRMRDASEVRHGSRWYLLAEEGAAWRPVGGPYTTRQEARAARNRALDRWSAVPWDIRREYTLFRR